MDGESASHDSQSRQGRLTNRQLAAVVALCFGMLAFTILYLVAGNTVSAERSSAAAARTAFTRGDLKATLRLAEAAVRAGAHDPVTLSLLGRARDANGDHAGAVAAYRASLAADHDQPLVMYELAVIALEDGEYRQAEADLRQAIAVDPGFVRCQLLLGDVLVHEGKERDARTCFQTVVREASSEADRDTARAKLAALQ